ncbi:hypothetical protein [Adhaeribacter rhizoryzae]|uniref:Uncharacterized protein n=1 Tax=Adhaeribacter rhizoryzae TaxID=2607907 RepID=A0A5M6DPW4_9BACT|nr:hypothetical protein [Adhaeribacter rhizoryzae]KAA5547515.1 hypothetical protein F0145_09350 [Adhaeribacter rhizoryzae]
METGLAKKLTSTETSAPKVKMFPLSINKSIVFSVDRKWASEGSTNEKRVFNRIGDRLTNLEISLTLDGTHPIEFNSWDKFVSDWVTVDLGKVTSSQQWSATANISATAGSKKTDSDKNTITNAIATKTGKADINQTENNNSSGTGAENVNGNEFSSSIGPSANLNFIDKYESSLNLLMSRMKFSGTLGRRDMVLRQEGGFGIDLSGNTSVSVELNYTGGYASPIYVFKVQDYYNAAGNPNLLSALKKEIILWYFPDIKNTLSGFLRFKYLYRHVKPGSPKHIPEARQSVLYKYGEVGYDPKYSSPQLVELIRPEDFKPITYRIRFLHTGNMVELQWNNKIINFEKAEEAAAFIEYLISLGSTAAPNYSSLTPSPSGVNLKDFQIIKIQN